MKSVAKLSLQKAHYLADQLTKIPGVVLGFPLPFFSEFVIQTPKSAKQVLKLLSERGILGGLDLSTSPAKLNTGILVAVTEMNKKDELDNYAAELKAVLNM